MLPSWKKASSFQVNLLFILSLLSLLSSVALPLLLHLYGLMGFVGTPGLSVTACSNQYHTLKYSNLTLVNKTIFLASLAAAVSSILGFFVCLAIFVQKCRQIRKSKQIAQFGRCALYLCICGSIMGSFIEVGYYITYKVQENSCTFTYDSVQIYFLLFLGVSQLVYNFLMLVTTLGGLTAQEDREQRYKQVVTKRTQRIQIQIRRTKEQQPHLAMQKQRFQFKFMIEDQLYLKDEQKRYLENYNNRAPILRAQYDIYGQRAKENAPDIDKNNQSSDSSEKKLTRISRNYHIERPSRYENKQNPQEGKRQPLQNLRESLPRRRRMLSPQKIKIIIK